MTDTITVSRELLRKAIESLEATCGHRCNAEYNPCNEQELVWQLRAALGAEPAPVQEPPSTPTYDYVKLTRAIYTRMQMECVGRSKWEELDGYEQQRFVAAVASTAPQQASVQEPCAELIDYILQDDTHNRLTPRVVDIAYSAWSLGRSGQNNDDGGPCNWFNDTKPMVMTRLAMIKKDLAEAAQTRKAVKLTDLELLELWEAAPLGTLVSTRLQSVQAAVWARLGLPE